MKKKSVLDAEAQSYNPIASVTSQPKPQKGQKNRSSGNFSTQDAPKGTKQIQWFVTENDNFKTIRFNIMRDISMWTDPVEFENVANGKVTNYISERSLYVANPKGADGHTFIVQAWPYPNRFDGVTPIIQQVLS